MEDCAFLEPNSTVYLFSFLRRLDGSSKSLPLHLQARKLPIQLVPVLGELAHPQLNSTHTEILQ
jgi:hypothetical protein